MEPITREEKLMVGEQLEPITRKEMFLAKAAGMDIETPEPITREEMFISMISGGGTGGSGGGGGVSSVSPKAVNFYDYDGTCLYAYTAEEAQALTEMPPLPERKGLICQGWNWSLEDVKEQNRALNVGAIYTTDDGTTRIYITLQDGRTSPMLGVCPNGTVTVDWGDGTEPDVLTGTSTKTVKWTPNHNYAKPGDYVIRLTVDGEMGFTGNSSANANAYTLRYSSGGDSRNRGYQNAIKRVEIGNGVTSIGAYAFYYCFSLASITIPEGATSIEADAFGSCYSLAFFATPKSMKSIDDNAFKYCRSLHSFAISEGVTRIEASVFEQCSSLAFAVLPKNLTYMNSCVFESCGSLAFAVFHKGLNSLGYGVFTVCSSIRYVDFSNHTAVPRLAGTDVFSSTPADLEIRVPAALYDEWIAATNWSTYASKIVAV